jgi:crotonobetainyl-CoA:carnitine CoA-transferase CaiB-like acyl-CoA transferase
MTGTEDVADSSAGPLAGLRVLDLSRLLPGGYATLILADLGADVIKVEEPGRGDYIRWMPPFASTGESGAHLALNRGKRSLTCNLKTEDGREILRELVRTADVLVESFRPGVMARLGVGYDDLKAVNPRLVYAAISGYGATGPYVDKAGHDINYLAYAGALSFSGHAATGPWPPGLQIGDLGGGGMHALIAILVALHVRERTGTGQFCDVSMTDGLLSWLTIHAGEFAVSGRPPRPGAQTLNGGMAWYGVYACADGKHLAVGALEPQFFRALVEALGVPELEGMHLDRERQDDVRRRLAEVFAARPREEWLDVLGDLDTCVAPVLDLAEAFADPSAQARGMVVPSELADGSTIPTVGVIPRLSDTPGRVGGPPSPLGADTDALLAELGRGPDGIAALRAAGAV